MFGYITTVESELKVREAMRYRSWYCGLCRCMRRRYGVLSTLFLQYDCAFLALLFSAELKEQGQEKPCRCLHRCHDPRRRYQAETPALRLCAGVNVMLAYYKCLDDWKDERSLLKGMALLLMRGAVRKAGREQPQVKELTQAYFESQRRAEAAGASLDEAADPTGQFLRSLTELLPFDPQGKPALDWLLYNLGRWIYLMDAWDDREKDQKKGLFNPYLQADYTQEQAAFGLYASLEEAKKAFDLLSPAQDGGIMENVLMLGCAARTRQVLRNGQEVGHESV